MDINNLGNQLNLKNKSIVKLLIAHQENREILEDYLTDKYEVLTAANNFENDDIIIVDEQGFAKHKEKILKIKQSNNFLYLPLILITRVSTDKIPEKYIKIIDEIIKTPIQQKILNSRIENLLNVRKLFLSTQIYQELTEKNPVGIAILFENKKIKYINQAFLDILGEQKENVLEKEITYFIENKKFLNQLSKHKIKDKEKLNINLNIDDQCKWLDIRCSNIIYQNINLKLLIMVDVTEQKKSEKEIKYLRFHDQLTGLYNRDYFMEELKRLDTERQLPLTIIMGDINSLKLVNDVFGHDRGDILIQNTAKILENNLRNEDILARIGGDEFAILLPNTEKKIGKEITNRINQNCSDFIGEGIISISLGVATKNSLNQDIDDVFKSADDNMYQNKTTESRKVKQEIISNINRKLRKESDESKAHIKMVKKLLLKFAESLDLGDEHKEKLKLLAESHDIGKISVKEVISKKENQLTEQELDKLKGHTEYGYRISHSIPNLTNIAEEILSHHERWDGKGYPQGLKHEEIPLLARIFTIVDHYDLLVNGRGSKNEKSRKEALKEIREQSGKQFDPCLVNDFIKFMNNKN